MGIESQHKTSSSEHSQGQEAGETTDGKTKILSGEERKALSERILQNPNSLSDAPTDMIIEAVKRDGSDLKYASESVKNDRDIVSEAVEKNGGFLSYASEELRDDEELALIAAHSKNFISFQDLSEGLRGDKELALVAVKQKGDLIEYASEELRDDEELALIAVRRYGGNLRYVSDRLKHDKKVIIEAMEHSNGMAIMSVPDELKDEIKEEMSKRT